MTDILASLEQATRETVETVHRSLALLYCALQPKIYHNHRTGDRVITIQLPTGEAGYNSGFFYCGKGEC